MSRKKDEYLKMKKAFEKYFNEYLKSLPTNEELKKEIDFSEDFEMKMRKIIENMGDSKNNE